MVSILAFFIFNSVVGGCSSAPEPQHAFVPPSELKAPRAGLNVMTLNMEHKDKPHQLEVVAKQLKADGGQMPDFILCQEVLFGRGGVENSTADVFGRLMGYDVRETKRTSDHEGIAILSRYPIEYYDSINLQSQTSPLLLGFRRVSTMAETTVPGIGKVRLVNVHFTNWGFEAHVRKAQLRETLQWAARREREVPAAVTFLAGDFNAARTYREMDLVKDRTLTAPLVFSDWNTTTPSHDSGKRIDHIFVSAKNPVQFSGEELLWKNGVPDGRSSFTLSDHLALVHHYQMPTANAAGTGGAVGTIRE